MKRYFDILAAVLFLGALLLGIDQTCYAQQQPASQQSSSQQHSSQQPMEIPGPYQYPQSQYPAQYPAQYPQQYPGQQYPSQGGLQSGSQNGLQGGDPQQQADPGAARVSYIQGDVATLPGGTGDWVAATVNTPVISGDHVSTGQQSRAEIELDQSNMLRMADSAEVNVANLSRAQIVVQVGAGLVNYDVLKGNQANIEIDTPNVAIRPQPGEGSYRILVSPDGQTVVDVRAGSADVSTPQGSTHVNKNQRITIQGNADSAQYQVSDAPGKDEWDRWNTDRDHAIVGAASWQYTNPNYTGTQDLDANGTWQDVPDYGGVWFPNEGPDWVPYRDGTWVFEPYYGWTWVSYEPWGWAPYHYGRWSVYDGRWGWWPGPVYPGYYPLWAPAYVSFFGFGGGWGIGFGFGFGGFGSIGWLPIGPGDWFHPWYGRGITRVNTVSVLNVNGGGFAPLRQGPRAFSNINGALNEDRYRNAISSMPSNQFGRGRVPAQQEKFDAASLRQASVMTGANPISPSRESYRPAGRAASPGAIPNRTVTSQRFFGSPRPGAASQSGFNRNANPFSSGQVSRPYSGNNVQGQSAGRGWSTFGTPVQGPRPVPTFEAQGPSQQPAPRPDYRRVGPGNSGYSRPPLNMQQPVVTPRRSPAYSAPQPRSMPPPQYQPPREAPRGGYPGAGNRGGFPQSGGSRGGTPSGHSSSGHRR